MLVCDLCGGKLVAQAGGRIFCSECGMEYSKQRIKEMTGADVQPAAAQGTRSSSTQSDAPSVTMAEISIERSRDGGCMFVPLNVSVDGVPMLKLKHGEKMSLRLMEGAHTLEFSNVYYSASLPLTIEHAATGYALRCEVGLTGKIKFDPAVRI